MKTKHLFYIASAMAIFFAACGGGEDKKAPAPTPVVVADPDDTITTEAFDTALATEYIDSFSTMAFSSYAKKQSTSFDWTRFRMEDSYSDSQLHIVNYKPDNKFYEAYGPFIKYSPDSSMFIDMDSYHVGMRKNDKGQWQGTELEPESEVALVNLKTGKKTRILFGGPNVSVEDALWLDKENLAIMGVEDQDSLGKVATVWKFNVPTNTYFVYELRDSVVARRLLGYWRKERLKGVLVQ